MRYLLEHTGLPTKATMPAMAQASALWLPGVSEAAYPTRDEHVADLVEIMRGEIAALAEWVPATSSSTAPATPTLVAKRGANA